MKQIAGLVAFAVLLVFPAHAQEDVESSVARFRLFNECKPMSLVVEKLNDYASTIGLTTDKLQVAVESRLRSARLYDTAEVPFLYVNVHVVDQAFSISVDYEKLVFDSVSGESNKAKTWTTGSTGMHGRNAGYILSSVSRHLDQFLVEYLRVNEEHCGR